jgi:hypothetical protein
MYNRHNSKEDTANPKILHEVEAPTLLEMIKKAQKELLKEVELMQAIGGGNPLLEYTPEKNRITLIADVDGFAVSQLFAENKGGMCNYHRARFAIDCNPMWVKQALDYYTSEAYGNTEYQLTGATS